MDDGSGQRPGLLARLVADPVRLRRWARVALLGLLGLVVASRLLGGAAGAWLTALTWVFAPLVAFGIGVGDAFFVRFGRSSRRTLLTTLASLVAVLSSCVVLAGSGDEPASRMGGSLIASLYALFYAGIVLFLAGLIALGIGRGEDYVSRRIDRMSREDW